VAYVRDFEPLADALKRVLAATSVKEDEAKRDICHAVADKKIAVQVRVATSDLSFGGRTFNRGNVGVPPHLNPDDFDWLQSRPLKRFSIGPQLAEHYSWIGGWEPRVIDLIESRAGARAAGGGWANSRLAITAGNEAGFEQHVP
jgi:hypothetical protein